MQAQAKVGGGAVSLTASMFDGTVLRVAAMAGVLGVEGIAITTWLDTGTLNGRGFIYVIAQSGPVVLRIAIAVAVLTLIFGSSTSSGPPEHPAWRAAPRVSLVWLTAHFISAGVFAGLSFPLFQERLPAALNSWLAAGWLLAGATAVMAASFVGVRPQSWMFLLRAKWRILAGALAVAAAACGLGWPATFLWQPMSGAALAVSLAMLHPFVPTATADPATFTLGTPEFSVIVSRECSGAEGLGLMLAFTVSWLWLHRAEWRFPHAMLLVPIGLSVVWLLNCLRIAGLVFIGAAGAPEVALGGFHSQAGWLAFNVAAIGICLAARRVRWLTTAPGRRSATVSASASNPTATSAASGAGGFAEWCQACDGVRCMTTALRPQFPVSKPLPSPIRT